MALKHAETAADRAAWARLWDLTCGPWERLGDLAEFLGVGRTTVQEWGPEGANAGCGAWPLLRLALRRTARRYPACVPVLVEALAVELLDVRVRVSVVRTEAEVGELDKEANDVVRALSRLMDAAESGDAGALAQARRVLFQQVEEVDIAAALRAK